MLEYLPAEIREGLHSAQLRNGARRRRLSLHQGDTVFSIRRMWDNGIAIAAADVTHLRGRVEIYEGPRHILSCLIQASDTDGEDLICTFKRASPVRDTPPLDYEVADPDVIRLLPGH